LPEADLQIVAGQRAAPATANRRTMKRYSIWKTWSEPAARFRRYDVATESVAFQVFPLKKCRRSKALIFCYRASLSTMLLSWSYAI